MTEWLCHSPGDGGCIQNDAGLLVVMDSAATNCESDSYGGGIYNEGGTVNPLVELDESECNRRGTSLWIR